MYDNLQFNIEKQWGKELKTASTLKPRHVTCNANGII